MDGLDLRKFQEDGEEHDKIKNIFGKLLSGKEGYETILEKRMETKKVIRCGCGWVLNGGEKFCPECGAKIGVK